MVNQFLDAIKKKPENPFIPAPNTQPTPLPQSSINNPTPSASNYRGGDIIRSSPLPQSSINNPTPSAANMPLPQSSMVNITPSAANSISAGALDGQNAQRPAEQVKALLDGGKPTAAPNPNIDPSTGQPYKLMSGQAGSAEDVVTTLLSGASAKLATTALSGLMTAGAKIAAGDITKAGAEAAAGILTKEAGEAAVNTVTEKLKMSFLTKSVRMMKNPYAVLGLISASIGSKGMNIWGEGEALDTLVYARGDAIKNGDTQTIEQIDSLRSDIKNPTWLEEILSYTPVIGSLKMFGDKVKAAEIKMEQQDKSQLKSQIEANAPPKETWEQQQDRIYAEKNAEEERQRKMDEAYYADIQAKKTAAEKANREEEAAFWDARARKAQDEADKKDAESRSYWAAQKKEQEDKAPSKLTFGLL